MGMAITLSFWGSEYRILFTWRKFATAFRFDTKEGKGKIWHLSLALRVAEFTDATDEWGLQMLLTAAQSGPGSVGFRI